MVRLLVLSTVLIFLGGCSSITTQSSSSSSASSSATKVSELNEVFLEESKNYPRLIELYKSKLTNSEDINVRLKLSQIYVDVKDFESALFTLLPIIKQNSSPAEAFYLQGVSLYGVGKLQQAEQSLQVARKKAPHDSKIINLLGVVQAEQGNLIAARQSFMLARELMYDDITIKNNLALLDMLEGDFKQAAARLMPIYISNKTAVDAKVRANLAIIVSKLGSFETLKSIYSGKFSDAELFDIFQNLRSSKPVTRASDSDIVLPKTETQRLQPLESMNSSTEAIIDEALSAEGAIKTEKVKDRQDAVTIKEKNNEASEITAIQTPSSVMAASQQEIDAYPKTQSLTFPQQQSINSSSNEAHALNQDRIKVSSQGGAAQGSVYLSEVMAQKGGQKKRSTTTHDQANFQDLVGIERHYEQRKIAESRNDAVSTSFIEKVESDVPAEELLNDKKPMQQPHLYSQEVKKTIVSGVSEIKHDFVKLSDYSLEGEDGLSIPLAQFRHHGNLIDIEIDSQGRVVSTDGGQE